MGYFIRDRDDRFDKAKGGPRRILALDGGGTRGIVTLCYLKRIEDILRARHDNSPGFRLAHYFDLIAGTSTGSIIAAGLAMEMQVDDLIKLYQDLANRVFRRNLSRWGFWRARFDHKELAKILQDILKEDNGAPMLLGSKKLKTGLLAVSKRMDTGSTWPLGNNPCGKYFTQREGSKYTANKDYPLWKVIRASTAAPYYFDPEEIVITEEEGKEPVIGRFVDGGVSPFNNPAFQAYMYATLDGYRVNWKPGRNQMLVVSVGTGRADAGAKATGAAAGDAIGALFGLMDDAVDLTETLMQWIGTGDTHRRIDSELGDLSGDSMGAAKCTYLRYDLPLKRHEINSEFPDMTYADKAALVALDQPGAMKTLRGMAERDAPGKVSADHFPRVFDLR
ncbi:Patatin [Candidatus Rhodobacter oscarellae]|uniref:Patatin n=1 Tax=Candidatus Rhodobacter oscarellae TaxID=1675527 RepID=A0A0J9EDV9_9RHOB|nr:patatin-like phospholipase family protein [Candidatus Rhodobacter lobularis]KMW60811.1 Patatin [Candidatus Rhodobacter lobularis]